MDYIVALIVKAVSALAGWARVFPGVEYAKYEPGQKLRVLLVGYNGARNTGSDVRVAALAEQLQAFFGAQNVQISVMTLDPESTAPYFTDDVEPIGISSLFFVPLLKACSEHHVAVLCEGSTFKGKFADALTLYTSEAAGVMRSQGKPCVAYGGEVGAMPAYLEKAVRSLCSDVLFIARSQASCQQASRLGMETRCGTDTAWTFDSSSGYERAMTLLRQGGWDGERPLLGVAPINPFWWPVKPSLAKWLATALGDRRFPQFQKWYFFSWSEERKERYRVYLDGLADAVRTFVAERGFQPVIIGMEALDQDACGQFAQRIGGRVPVVLSKNQDGYAIGEILRSLTALVTSRYHAQVLAMGADVPTVAVSMDERLDNLADEFGLPADLLVHVDDADLAPRVLLGLDYAIERRDEIALAMRKGREIMVERLDDMAEWFAGFLQAAGIAAARV